MPNTSSLFFVLVSLSPSHLSLFFPFFSKIDAVVLAARSGGVQIPPRITEEPSNVTVLRNEPVRDVDTDEFAFILHQLGS